MAVRLINKTGSASVKGSLVAAGSAYDSVVLQSAEYDTLGVMLENGVPDGSYCWVQIGGKCQMLLKDTVGSTLGHVVFAADDDGRCITAAVPTPPNADEHFKEVGHCIETVAGGTSKLVWVIAHFN
jgi:hypothetical protein